MKRIYMPSLVLVAGTVGATAIAVLTRESGWLVLFGPFALAGVVLAAREIERRLSPTHSASFLPALLLGAICIVTGVVMFLRDPSQVPLAVASLGSVAIVTSVSTVALGGSGK